MAAASKSRPSRPVLIELSSAVVAVCASAWVLLLYSWPGPFHPAAALYWVAPLRYVLAAAAAAAAFWFLQRRQRRYPDSEAEHYNAFGLNQFLALLIGLAVLALAHLPLQLLHRWSPPERATWVEAVRLENMGSDGECQRRAWVQGDSALSGARLCIDFNDALYRRLAESGRVEITGTRSRYGTAVESFGPVPDASGRNAR